MGTGTERATQDAAWQKGKSGQETVEICFLLLNNFSLLSFASAIEPLRIANKVLKRKAYIYSCQTLDGRDAIASNGGMVRADGAFDGARRPDLLAVCSSDDVEQITLTGAEKALIRQVAKRAGSVAGICTGAYVLAGLGMLDNRNCTIHWEYADLFRELYPNANLVDSLIQTDGKLLTCAGGTAALDLMIGFIAQVHGGAVACDVAEIALHHDRRTGSERQHTLMRDDLDMVPHRVRTSIALMTEHVSDPLSLQQIADLLDVSPRQLQRDFQKYLNCSPQEYYSKIRIDIARQLVCRTSMRMIDIAVACGFASASHFSNRYRAAHGNSPAFDRQTTGRSRGNRS
ncbi:GlxA family transcriptional regulator [Roseibium sediminicola]|uniref:GlxA family transcriptional regulator n=1 Tax=Roseibium sediminicola TaxID=2933272 RepID=A0ABT0GN27_9HYPH|nr:GlxA family transcriptional regulator [Roseibium sp. CAU 1639]MCK7610818.1 GlxA family transcriptional regulator [Roseibium sp. CAU 1639]